MNLGPKIGTFRSPKYPPTNARYPIQISRNPSQSDRQQLPYRPMRTIVSHNRGSGAATRNAPSLETTSFAKPPNRFRHLSRRNRKLGCKCSPAKRPPTCRCGWRRHFASRHHGYLSMPNTTTKLAIIPSGTANDYAASLYQHASTNSSTTLKVDVGMIRHTNFQRYFLNVAGIGLTAHAALSSRPSPWLPARLRYTLGLMRTLTYGWRHTNTTLEIHSQIINAEKLLTLSVAIGSREGSFPLAPHAQLDDGKFNILLATGIATTRCIALTFPD
ncbi:diacylglycerol kinase family lipid kinase [Biomphalaria pfeifferi]|uniref:Diacylglycerol kinase family lipid kinase n=1 Tax=Biomphalaria pfeifferi TaxID=112525 RepID=A0AAD8ESU5_BIOPF|nr:diacylglycerol kinase family lipid kinase [Biomphalaria pfeifferi]